MRLIISTRPWRTGLPSGQPATARMCCSNCDTEAPSSVQWPELCTRGAISLTSRPPSREHEHLHRQHADIIELLRDRFGDARASCAASPETRAGTREIFKNMISMFVLGHVETFDRAVMARARRRRKLRSANGTNASRMQGCAPTARHAASADVGIFDGRLALAVVTEPPRLEHRRPADPL